MASKRPNRPVEASLPVEATTPAPTLASPSEGPPDAAKQAFIDAAAIAVYASGWPAKTVFERARQLWALREKDLDR